MYKGAVFILFIFFSCNLYATSPLYLGEDKAPIDEIKEYEDIPPIPKIMDYSKKSKPIATPNQYTGDHSFVWYEKNKKKSSYYIAFHLQYSTFRDPVNMSLDKIEYPDGIITQSTVKECPVDNPICAAEQKIDAIKTNTKVSIGTIVDSLLYNGTVDTKGGLGFGVAFGYQYRKFLRLEAELSQQRVFIEKFNNRGYSQTVQSWDEKGPSIQLSKNDVLKANSLMANLLFEYYNKTRFSPFIGIGGGTAIVGTSGGDINFTPAYQLKGGISFKVSDAMSLHILYRYFTTTKEVEYEHKVLLENTDTITYTGNEIIYHMRHDVEYDSLEIGYRFEF